MKKSENSENILIAIKNNIFYWTYKRKGKSEAVKIDCHRLSGLDINPKKGKKYYNPIWGWMHVDGAFDSHHVCHVDCKHIEKISDTQYKRNCNQYGVCLGNAGTTVNAHSQILNVNASFNKTSKKKK